MRLWFCAKTYGYGWTPCTWQGWLVILVYIMLTISTVHILDLSSHEDGKTLFLFFSLLSLYTFVLLLICLKTGEKPRWRWGKD